MPDDHLMSLLPSARIANALRASREREFESYLASVRPAPNSAYDFARLQNVSVHLPGYPHIEVPQLETHRLKVRSDLAEFEHGLRQYLYAGVSGSARRLCDFGVLTELAHRLEMTPSGRWLPAEIAVLLQHVPVTFAATPRATSPHLGLLDLPPIVPVVRYGSMGGLSFRALARLAAVWVVSVVADGSIQWREDRYTISHLQRGARVYAVLLADWLFGIWPSTPAPRDEDLLLALTAGGSIDTLVDGLVAGYSAFEGLHEFGHVCMGHWLRPTSCACADDEYAADRFAVECMVIADGATQLSTAVRLRGVHLYLGNISAAELLFGRSHGYPAMHVRLKRIYDLARSRLHGDALQYFEYLDEIELVGAFHQYPPEYGTTDRYGENHGTTA